MLLMLFKLKYQSSANLFYQFFNIGLGFYVHCDNAALLSSDKLLLFKVIELHNTLVYPNNCICSKIFKCMIILDVLIIYKVNIVLINSMTLLRLPMIMFLVICCIAHMIPIKRSDCQRQVQDAPSLKFHKKCLVYGYFIFKCIAKLYLFIRNSFLKTPYLNSCYHTVQNLRF